MSAGAQHGSLGNGEFAQVRRWRSRYSGAVTDDFGGGPRQRRAPWTASEQVGCSDPSSRVVRQLAVTRICQVTGGARVLLEAAWLHRLRWKRSALERAKWLF